MEPLRKYRVQYLLYRDKLPFTQGTLSFREDQCKLVSKHLYTDTYIFYLERDKLKYLLRQKTELQRNPSEKCFIEVETLLSDTIPKDKLPSKYHSIFEQEKRVDKIDEYEGHRLRDLLSYPRELWDFIKFSRADYIYKAGEPVKKKKEKEDTSEDDDSDSSDDSSQQKKKKRKRERDKKKKSKSKEKKKSKSKERKKSKSKERKKSKSKERKKSKSKERKKSKSKERKKSKSKSKEKKRRSRSRDKDKEKEKERQKEKQREKDKEKDKKKGKEREKEREKQKQKEKCNVKKEVKIDVVDSKVESQPPPSLSPLQVTVTQTETVPKNIEIQHRTQLQRISLEIQSGKGFVREKKIEINEQEIRKKKVPIIERIKGGE